MEQIIPFFQNLWVQLAMMVLVATFHGYGAAWLAVRMLFRPRRPVRFLGLTIFPQGMIPRNRERLAEAIGTAVGEELVSQETLIGELFDKGFLQKKIQSVVDAYTEDLLSQSYPSLIEALPPNLREPVLEAIFSLQLKVAGHIESVLHNEETVAAIRGFVDQRVDQTLARRISETIDDETARKILDFLETRIRSALESTDFEAKIEEFIGRRLDELMSLETPLGQMLTGDAIDLLKDKAAGQIEPIVHQLAELATAPRTRNQIAALIKTEVHNYYEQLPFFKKIFVSRDNLLDEVDDLVNESLPRRLEETLRGEFFAEEARNFIGGAIDNAVARPLPEVVGKIAPDQLEKLKAQISKSILSVLQGDEMMRSVSAYLTDALENLRPHSLGALLQTLHTDTEEKLKKMLTRGLLGVLNREDTVKIINSFLANQIDRLLSTPIGRLSDHMSEEKVRHVGASLTETIIAAAREKLPEAISEFNVGGVVREKINNYPVEKLETLVLSVAKEHLRKIEFFGALFGLIIGLLQAAYTYFAFAR